MFFALLRGWGEGLEGVIKHEVKAAGRGNEEDLTYLGEPAFTGTADDTLTLGLRKIHNTDSKGRNELMS